MAEKAYCKPNPERLPPFFARKVRIPQPGHPALVFHFWLSETSPLMETITHARQ